MKLQIMFGYVQKLQIVHLIQLKYYRFSQPRDHL